MAAAAGSVIVGAAACTPVTVATAAAAPIRPAIFLSMISPVNIRLARSLQFFLRGYGSKAVGEFRSAVQEQAIVGETPNLAGRRRAEHDQAVLQEGSP